MEVTEKMLKRYDCLLLVEWGDISLEIAAEKLNLSYRHTQRLMKRFREEGVQGLRYKRVHPAWNKTPKEIEKRVVELRRNGYQSYNISHFTDALREEEGIELSREKIRQILFASGDHKPLQERRGKPRKRFEAPKAGILVQMDTSFHKWIPAIDKTLALVVTLDDHSREILSARFFERDTTYNNMIVLKEAIEKHGLFHILYTDNDSKFKYIRYDNSRFFKYRKNPDDVTTQIHRALLELGIGFTHTHLFDPHGKGKIERLFRFMQDRIPKELEKKEIKTIKEANRYLQRWVKWYNRKRVHSTTKMIPEERAKNSAYIPLKEGIDLDKVFSIITTRVVKKDNTISYKGEVYQLKPDAYRMNWAKAVVELRIHPEKEIKVFYKGRLIQKFKCKNGAKSGKRDDILP